LNYSLAHEGIKRRTEEGKEYFALEDIHHASPQILDYVASALHLYYSVSKDRNPKAQNYLKKINLS